MPSSLLLGVTTFLTTDVAAVPLLWIVPLVIYLLTFVLVFARRVLVPHARMMRMLPIFVLPLAWLIAFDTSLPVAILAPIHLITFFFAAMVCHGELAQAAARRPLPHGVLPEHVGWRRARGPVQRARRAAVVFDGARVSARARARVRPAARAIGRI